MILVFPADLNAYLKKETIQNFKVNFIKTTLKLSDKEKMKYSGKGKMLRIDNVGRDDLRMPVDFYRDYYLDSFCTRLKSYVNSVTVMIEKPYMKNPETKYHYLKDEIETLEGHIKKLDQVTRLDPIKAEMTDEIQREIDNLESRLPKVYIDIEQNKFKFNLKKREVCLLFTYLRDHNIICTDYWDDKKLGLQLDLHFMYQDDNSKKYMLINNSYNTINKNRKDNLHRTESKKLNKILKLTYQ